jgi:hypothetical protein
MTDGRVILLFALLLCQAAGASEPSVTFPLQGYYRSGKYMPVHVRADASPTYRQLVLKADGTVPTAVEAGGNIDAIIPWLVVRSSVTNAQLLNGDRQLRTIDYPLHALADDEAIVGFAGADADVLKPALGDRKIIGVPLDLGQPLAGPVAAWEALDGVVLDAQSAARVTEAQLQGLLAGGTAIAIRSSTRPAGQWPWQRQGEYWILHLSVAGPDAVYDPAAYAPTASWTRGWPDDFRRLTLMAAILFSILASALTLWRSRISLLGVLVLCAAAVGGTVIWRERQPPSTRAGGDIVVLSRDFTQRDHWTYCGVLRPAIQSIQFVDVTHPILGYRTQIEQTELELHCGGDGIPRHFSFRLQPGWSIAFLERSVWGAHPQLSPSNPVYSPLRGLVEEQYLRQGDRLLGQASAPEPDWPTVVMER